jgi:hypothetical protein
MPDTTRTVTVRRVAPAAMAAWLHAQGQEPSSHVLLWFKRNGVAWPPVTASGGAAAPALRAEDAQDFAGLVRYRQQFKGLPAQQRPAWMAGHVAIVRDAMKSGSSRAALAEQLGMTSQGLADVLKRHPEPGPATASPFPVPRSTSKAQ